MPKLLWTRRLTDKTTPTGIAILLNIIIISIILYTVVMHITNERDRILKEAEINAGFIVKGHAQNILNQLEHIDLVLRQLNVELKVLNLDGTEKTRTIHNLLLSFQNTIPNAKNILYIDTHGQVLIETDFIELNAQFLNQCPGLLPGGKNKTTSRSIGYWSHNQAQSCPYESSLYYRLTIRNEMGEVQGFLISFLVEELLTGNLPEEVKQLENSAQYSTLNQTQQGFSVVSASSDFPEVKMQANLEFTFAQWNDAETGGSYRLIQEPVPGFPLSVLIQYSKQEILDKNWRGSSARYSILLAIGIVLSWLILSIY